MPSPIYAIAYKALRKLYEQYPLAGCNILDVLKERNKNCAALPDWVYNSSALSTYFYEKYRQCCGPLALHKNYKQLIETTETGVCITLNRYYMYLFMKLLDAEKIVYPQLNLIEVIESVKFDHSLVMINRPTEHTHISPSAHWTNDTIIIDTWQRMIYTADKWHHFMEHYADTFGHNPIEVCQSCFSIQGTFYKRCPDGKVWMSESLNPAEATKKVLNPSYIEAREKLREFFDKP